VSAVGGGDSVNIWQLLPHISSRAIGIPCGRSATIHPQNEQVICGGGNRVDGIYVPMEVWDIDSEQFPILKERYFDQSLVQDVDISADGSLLAYTPADELIIEFYDEKERREFAHLTKGEIYPDVDFIAHDTLLQVGSYVYTLETLSQVQQFNRDDAIFYDQAHSFVVSDDGEFIAILQDGHTIEIRKLMSGASLRTLKTNQLYYNLEAISPNNQLLVARRCVRITDDYYAVPDCFIDIIDIETGDIVISLSGHRESILQIKFSPDGRFLVSASGSLAAYTFLGISSDSTVRIWGVPYTDE
jgi:WD40 repeat protein